LRIWQRLINLFAKRPSFIIVGAQKAGTTSLYHWLNQHPNIVMSKIEEPHYFDGVRSYPDQNSYRKQFHYAGSERVVFGEKTPAYCYIEEAIPRIAQYDPDMKLIMILRNPTHRAISHYAMELKRGNETLSLAEAIEQEAERIQQDPTTFSYVTRGYYVEQLRRMYKHFPPNQIFVRCFENMVNREQDFLDELLEFLEVPTFEFHNLESFRVGEYSFDDAEVYQRLNNIFKPYNQQLTEEFGIPTDLWV